MSDPIEIGPKYVNPNKKYGLILPKNNNIAKKPVKVLKPTIFDEDDELEDDEKPQQSIKIKVNTNESRIKKQTQINIEKALEEDPSVFEYDEIYSELEAEKAKSDPKAKNANREPKYIVGLMKAAAVRQMEYERTQDRKIQKERETEGNLFADKESFVTEAYRKRMEEREKLEEEERKQEQLEAMMDVRKQKDLSAFYDSLLKVKSGEMKIEEEGEKEKRLERERLEKEERERKEKEFSKKSTTSKSYRKRQEETKEESSEEEQIEEEKQIEVKDKTAEIQNEEPEFKKPRIEPIKEDECVNKENQPEVKQIETKAERWQRLFTKRTVKKKFDQELVDYFRRKDELLSAKLYIERD